MRICNPASLTGVAEQDASYGLSALFPAFPAKMEVKDGIAKANGKLIIDRTDWGIRYGSGKFYDILADEIVSDNIEFFMKIVAKK